MMCIIGGIDVGTLLQQVIVNLQRIRRGMPHCLTLLLYTLAANCAPEGGGAKSAVCDCLVLTVEKRNPFFINTQDAVS